jgi:hypothetical protein
MLHFILYNTCLSDPAISNFEVCTVNGNMVIDGRYKRVHVLNN